jgi:DNA-binding SARP family transcriptional activator
VTIEFRILGPLEVAVDGGLVTLPARQQRVLLSALLIDAGQVVSTDRLIDALWGESPPPTAKAALHNVVAELRRLLSPGGEPLTTRPPGYVVTVEDGRFDLREFEAALEQGRSALADGEYAVAAQRTRAALALWRGEPLADVTYETFAAPSIARLGEMRMVAMESRIEADLALGLHAELIGELRELVAASPMREVVRGQLMLALYRSGRQPEALDVYREWRERLGDELGLDPSPVLQRLEGAILRRDPSLDPPPGKRLPAPGEVLTRRAVLLAAADEPGLDELIEIGRPLAARDSTHELILVRVVAPGGSTEADSAALSTARLGLERRRARLALDGVESRAAVCVSDDPAVDAARIARHQDVDLILMAARPAERGEAPCDAAALVNQRTLTDGPVLVPFGAAEDEWAALELGAWLAAAHGRGLRLAGSAESSGLLATASLIVQRATGVSAEPLLVEHGAKGMLEAALGCSMLVLGLPSEGDGLGEERQQLADQATIPVLAVRGGARPGGMAPSHTVTRFRWSLGAGA